MLIRLDNRDSVVLEDTPDIHAKVQKEDAVDSIVRLVREKYHPHREYSVAVYRHNGDFLGYIKKPSDAKRIALSMDNNKPISAVYKKIERGECVIDVEGAIAASKIEEQEQISSIDPIDFVAIDFETATMARYSPCSVGIAIIRNGQIVDSFSRLIKPHQTQKPFEPKFVKLHGISEKTVENAPEFDKVWEEIKAVIQESLVVVAHNMSFDAEVLRQTMLLYDIPISRYITTLCTVGVSRTVWPELPNHKLPTVVKSLHLSLNHHEAQSDAIASAEIILSACKKLGARNLRELNQKAGHSFGYITSDRSNSPNAYRRTVYSNNYDNENSEEIKSSKSTTKSRAGGLPGWVWFVVIIILVVLIFGR